MKYSREIGFQNAGEILVNRHPEVGAVVVKCTNMPPYAEDVQRVLGLPVYDVVIMIVRAVSGEVPNV